MVEERLSKLRKLMEEKGLQAYIISTDDFHGSEYVGEYFKARAYMSGFTGSAGTLVVLEKEAALWTDGRYFLQAEKQLEGNGITLMKMGEAEVPTIGEYLQEMLSERSVIGFDGRTVTSAFIEKIKTSLGEKRIYFMWDIDLVGEIWTDRPSLSKEPVWELSVEYAGMSRKDKLSVVRKMVEEAGADLFVLTSLDDIAWLLNLRGNDVACNPVFLSYMCIEKNHAVLYCQSGAIGADVTKRLEADGVMLREYGAIYEDLKCMDEEKTVLIDTAKANYMIQKCIPEGVHLIDKTSPVMLLKAMKNETECKHIRNAHVKDGVAVTRFMYWIKNTVKTEQITEIGAAQKLEELRTEQEGYLGPSFEPIMAYGAHGAIVHYSATEESNAILKPEGLFLSDTGGQYMEGTTDITRTYALGELTEEEKRDYTLVLKGNLNLAAAKFLYGVKGVNLDYLARSPLWEYGLDYNHGTGHGVGYLLNVHEGPNAFRWKILSKEEENAVLTEGMVTSDEPGVYIAGRFGIRLENLILCQKAEQTEYGQFMCFETLTMVPFDLEAVDVKYLNDRDIELLNAYHARVYEMISPYLAGDELTWLRHATRKIAKDK